MSEVTDKKAPLPLWRRILLILVLVAIVLLGGLLLLNFAVGKQLGAEIVKISEAGEPLTLSDLQAKPTTGSTGKSATSYYTEALSTIGIGNLRDLRRANAFYRKNLMSLPVNQFPSEASKQTAQSLANLQPILEKFDVGAALPLSRFDTGLEQGLQIYQARLRRIQTSVFLLSLRTMDLIRQGKEEAAVNSVISLLKMTRLFGSYPPVILNSNKVVCVGHACDDIGVLLQSSRPSDKSLTRLKEVLLQTMPTDVLGKIFIAERAYQTEIAINLIPANITSRFLLDAAPDLPGRLFLSRSYLEQLRVRRKAVWFYRNMAQLIAAAHRPWPEPLDVIVYNPPESMKKSKELLVKMAASVSLTSEVLDYVRCTIAAVAIEQYRRSHNKLPDGLDKLSPNYLDSVPLDPFTGKELLYSSDEESYIVYSVGINRQDDGGAIKRTADKKPRQDCGLRIRLSKLQ